MTSQKRLEDYTELELLVGHSLSKRDRREIIAILERSKQRLIQDGWCKGTYYSCEPKGVAPSFCLHGAVRHDDGDFESVCASRDILRKLGYTVEWNDNCSSVDEVTNAIDKCIALVKEEL